MFIAILTYRKPLSEVERYLPAHREFLAEHYRSGAFIASGPQVPRTGGVILMKGSDRATVDRIIARDPFYLHGIAEYRIVEFAPSLFCDRQAESLLCR